MYLRLDIPPGAVSDPTPYAAGARWVAAQGVRFFDSTPERIGGAALYQPVVSPLVDTPKHIAIWATSDLYAYTSYGCRGSHLVSDGTRVYDTTPVKFTYVIPTITINTPAGSAQTMQIPGATIEGVDTTLAVGDYIKLSGYTGAGLGTVTAAYINGTHQVVGVSNAPAFYDVTVGIGASTAGAVPMSGSTVVLDVSISFARTISSGNVVTIGYGLGGYGGTDPATGVSGFGGATANTMYLWSQDTFGSWLVYNARGNSIYVWDPANPNQRALTLPQLYLSLNPTPDVAPLTDYPLRANYVLMADRSRQLIVLGTNDTLSTEFDPMLIRWSDVEDLTAWTPALTNQSGSLRVTDGSEIVAAVRTRQDILVFTDTALYALSYIGAPEVFGLRPLATNISVLGPNAIASDDDIVYWMAADGFYRYDGRVTRLPCPISRAVKTSLPTSDYKATAVAGVNKAYQEIWFSYPEGAATSNTKTVIFNTINGAWSTWDYGRDAWATGGLVGGPIAASGYYPVQHEQGLLDYSTGTGVGFSSYVQSGAIEMSDSGEKFMFISKLLPDINLPDTASTATVTLTTQHDAGGSTHSNDTGSGSIVKDVTSFTAQIDLRARGRQVSIRTDGPANSYWKLGSPRLHVRPDGRR